jgi:hypothetical protein
MEVIQQHILDTTSIDVTKLILSRAGNPASYISTDGKVKVIEWTYIPLSTSTVINCLFPIAHG